MKRKYFLLAIAILLCTTNLIAQVTGSFTDARDGKTYKTIQIGSKVWMAENLAYRAVGGCWAYGNDETNVKTYGYLYNWAAAQKASPMGWHVATVSEWEALTAGFGGKNVAGTKLKAATGWSDNGAGGSQFNGLPGGRRTRNENSFDKGREANWWSSIECIDDRLAIYYGLGDMIANMTGGQEEKRVGFSVRCVKDETVIAPVKTTGKAATAKPVRKVYDKMGDFTNGLAQVGLNDKYGFINESGDEVVPVIYEDSYAQFREDKAAVKLNGKWGFVNTTGVVVIPCVYDEAYNFWGTLAGVRKGEKWGFIDGDGKVIIAFEYEDIKVFRNGYGHVKLAGEWWRINRAGELSLD